MRTLPPLKTVTPLIQLDELFSGSQDFMSNYEQAVGSLQGDSNLGTLAGNRVSADLADHFRSHWLSEWWPELQPIDPMLRDGLIEAITVAQSASLPLSGLWIQTSDIKFETFVQRSPNQITLLVISPPVPPTHPT